MMWCPLICSYFYSANFIFLYYTRCLVNNPLANAGDIRDMVRSLAQEVRLKQDRATHSSILAWIILWTEEPGRLLSLVSPRVRHN